MTEIKINVLGTEYAIISATEKDEPRLCGVAGFCDTTTKEIYLETEYADNDVGNVDAYRKKVCRHEIIHAFLYESGLAENTYNPQCQGEMPWATNETIIDWMAIQMPKIVAVWMEVDSL